MDKLTLTPKDLKFEPPSFSCNFLLNELKNSYGLGGILTPLAGERDQNHLLQTHGGHQYILKVAGPDEDRSVVDYQIKALLHVEQKNLGLNIPRNLKTLKGQDFTLIKSTSGREHMMRLLTFLDGVPFGESYNPSINTLYNAGRFQGSLCAALVDFSHPSQGHFMPWDISRGLVLSPSLQHSKYGEVERLVLPLLDHFENDILPKMDGLRKQTIHNDGHDGNILKSAADMDDFYGLIDFGDIVYAPIIQDLAIPLTRFVGLSSDPVACGSAYVEGFASAYPLLPPELDILYDLILLRACLTIQLMDFRIKHNDVNSQGLIAEYPRLVTMLENLIAVDGEKLTHAFHHAHEKGIKK